MALPIGAFVAVPPKFPRSALIISSKKNLIARFARNATAIVTIKKILFSRQRAEH
jgi:hypothetical protein